jgi:hypothetical protein
MASAGAWPTGPAPAGAVNEGVLTFPNRATRRQARQRA